MGVVKEIHVLSKIFSLCCRNGFFITKSTSPIDKIPGILNGIIGYGPLGTALRRNLLEEWQYSIVTTCHANVQSIHYPDICYVDSNNTKHNNTIQWIVDYAIQMEITLPFGLTYSTIDSSTLQQSTSQNPCSEKMTLSFFCHHSLHQQWMVYWQRRRLKWWKQFARCPENFVIEENQSLLTIKYVLPTIKEEMIVEVINVDILQSLGIDQTMSVITVSTRLNNSLWSILVDAFLDDYRQWGEQPPNALLKLHRRLSPVKVALLSQETSSDQQLIAEELNYVGIIAHCPKEGSLERRLAHQDIIGTPSRVLLDDDTLATGIIYLQDRDSGLSEPMECESLLHTVLRMYQRYHKDIQ